MSVVRRLLVALLVPADRLRPRWWSCPSCRVTHYADEQHGWKTHRR